MVRHSSRVLKHSTPMVRHFPCVVKHSTPMVRHFPGVVIHSTRVPRRVVTRLTHLACPLRSPPSRTPTGHFGVAP